jgi:hypothetical protein
VFEAAGPDGSFRWEVHSGHSTSKELTGHRLRRCEFSNSRAPTNRQC